MCKDLRMVWLPAPYLLSDYDTDLYTPELIRRTVCIGRGPGIRREDVNKAVCAAAIIDV